MSKTASGSAASRTAGALWLCRAMFLIFLKNRSSRLLPWVLRNTPAKCDEWVSRKIEGQSDRQETPSILVSWTSDHDCCVRGKKYLDSRIVDVTSEEVKACYVLQTTLWNLTETTLVRVSFWEIKADIMFLALEPVTLRIWCLESNIYDSDITNSLLIFSWANLRCQISLLNFKGWYRQRSSAEVMKWYLNHLGLVSVKYWLMFCSWAKWSFTLCFIFFSYRQRVWMVLRDSFPFML